jgi:hypothetical protein
VKWPLHDAPGRLTVPTYPSPEPKSGSSQTTSYGRVAILDAEKLKAIANED